MGVVDTLALRDPVSGFLAEINANNELSVIMASQPLPTGAATEATLLAIKTAVEVLDNAIAGSEMQVDIVAALPAGTNNIGKVVITDGTDDAAVIQLSVAPVGTDKGILTQSVIHGLNSGGGGSYVDVKVNPSGALVTAIGDISSIDGQATMANSIPVVIASDQSFIKTRLTDGTTDAEVIALAGYNAQAVAIVDGTGAQITSFGGGIQYDEGDTDASITGTAILWEDTADTLRAVSAAKPLPVNIVAGSAAGTEYTEDVASAADPVGGMLMAVRKDTLAAITTTDGDNIALRATNRGEVYVKQSDAIPLVSDTTGSGTITGTGNTEFDVDPVGTFILQVTGTYSLTAILEGTIDGSTWIGIPAKVYSSYFSGIGTLLTSPASVSSWSTYNLHFHIPIIGFAKIRINCSAYTSGTLNYSYRTSVIPENTENDLVITSISGNVAIQNAQSSQEVKEDNASTTNEYLFLHGGIRKDTPATVTDTDGDFIIQRFTNYGAGYVQLVTSAGAFIDSMGGGTEYTDGGVTPGNPIGKAILWDDAGTWKDVSTTDPFPIQLIGAGLTSLQLLDDAVNTDATAIGTKGLALVGSEGGTARILNADSAGRLTVIDQNSLSTLNETTAIKTAVQLIDDTVIVLGTDTYTETTSKGLIMAAVRRDADTTLVGTTNEYTPLQVDANGRLKVEAFAGEVLTVLDTNSAAMLTALQLIDNTIFVDNSGFTDNSSSVSVAGYYFDETAGTALTENDVAAARIDSKRAQVHVIEDGTTRGLRAGVVDETGASAVDAFAIGGGTPHDSVDSGNPLKIGGRARTTNPTAVADNDRVNAAFDDLGRPVMVIGQVRDLITDQTTTITASTAETTILTAAASTFHDVVSIMIANTSATATRVDIRDTTAGSVRFSIYVPAGVTVGTNVTRPIKQATVNTNWTAQSSASVTDLRIFVQAEKNI